MFMVLFGRRVFLNSPCQLNLTPQSADTTRQWWVTCVIESWLLLSQESVLQGSSDPWSRFYIIRVKYRCRMESQCLPPTPCWRPLRSTVMEVNGRCLHLFYFFHLSLMLSNSHSLATFHHWAHFLDLLCGLCFYLHTAIFHILAFVSLFPLNMQSAWVWREDAFQLYD